jgi:outer membrane protein assembly factor BamA
MRSAGLVVSLSLLGFVAAPLRAQTPANEPATRAELLRDQREAKQEEVEPYEQNAVERMMHLAEERIVPLLNRDGIYARFGSLTTGSGFAYGAGYRDRSLLRGRGRLDLWAAGSLKRYWAVEGRAAYPLTPGEGVMVELYGRHYVYPVEEFFGIGPNAFRSDQVEYDLRGDIGGLSVDVAVHPRLTFGGGVEYTQPRTKAAASDGLPSIERVFGRAARPGFGVEHRFVRSLAHVQFDYRQPLNARRGGLYRLDASRFDDQRGGGASFTRVDLDLRQYVSFLAERRVLAGRVLVSTTDADTNGGIPFFLLPSLGGNDTLRGFRAHRFRGPHAILLQGEYRFEIWSGLDGALFADAGKVALRRSDLNLRDLERDFGFGFRFNTDNGVIVRVDAAFGSRDGKHLHVVFGGLF